MEDIFVKTPRLIYFNFFPIFFPKSKLLNSGCGLSASAAYTPVFTVITFIIIIIIIIIISVFLVAFV